MHFFKLYYLFDSFSWNHSHAYILRTIIFLQLFAKLQAIKCDIQDLQEEHARERQELEQTQNELTRDLKLK